LGLATRWPLENGAALLAGSQVLFQILHLSPETLVFLPQLLILAFQVPNRFLLALNPTPPPYGNRKRRICAALFRSSISHPANQLPALTQVAEHPAFTAINAFKTDGEKSRCAFRINDSIGISRHRS
jgi:hypothetical protein